MHAYLLSVTYKDKPTDHMVVLAENKTPMEASEANTIHCATAKDAWKLKTKLDAMVAALAGNVEASIYEGTVLPTIHETLCPE